MGAHGFTYKGAMQKGRARYDRIVHTPIFLIVRESDVIVRCLRVRHVAVIRHYEVTEEVVNILLCRFGTTNAFLSYFVLAIPKHVAPF
jgi:hypothetical protein